MNSPDPRQADQHGSAGAPTGEGSGPPPAEDTRARILRSRAISESEARLAASIDASTSRALPQAREDAVTLPPEAAPVDPAEKA